MDGMMQEMGEGQPDAYLEVLQEIKDLMDSRVGDKLKAAVTPEVEAPVDAEASMEAAPVAEEPEEDMGLSPEEMDELKNKVYSKA